MIVVLGKSIPTELGELLKPSSSAMLIIDMQNDYCSDSGAVASAGGDTSGYEAIISRIAHLADECRQLGVLVIHVRTLTMQDGRSDSAAWLRLRVRANINYGSGNSGPWMFTVEGTWGADFVPALVPKAGDLVVTKHRSTAFHQTDLDLILRSNGITTLIVCGCTTEGCVESTVRDATFYDYFPIVPDDCVGSDSIALHNASLTVMGAYRADISNATEISRLLTLGPPK